MHEVEENVEEDATRCGGCDAMVEVEGKQKHKGIIRRIKSKAAGEKSTTKSKRQEQAGSANKANKQTNYSINNMNRT